MLHPKSHTLNESKTNTHSFRPNLSYGLLVWMFHGCTINNKVHEFKEKCLRMIYDNKTLSLNYLLQKDTSVSKYTRNL